MAGYSQKRLLDDIYSGKVSKFNLPGYLFEYTFEALSDEVNKVFDKKPDLPDAPESIKRKEVVSALNANIARFSGAKTFQEVNDISKFLFDDKGFKMPFKQFEEIAKPVDDIYNKTWLKTEQDTSFGQAQSADSWLQYEDEEEIFPLLQYQTSDDERVRHDHAAWDNLIYPVGHSFWDTRMPLNGYNCRCRVIQLREGEESSTKGVPKNEDKPFQNNAGKTGEVFTDKHPYFKVKKKDQPLTRDNFGLGVI